MMLTGKNILLISPEPWTHIFVSKHHYAVYLAKLGNRVFFLNPPLDQKLVTGTEFMNVFSVNYNGFPKGLRFYPGFLQRYFIRKEFEELQLICNTKFDIVWSFDNSVFHDFNSLPDEVLKISHIVDLSQNFQTRIAARTANVCFCTTEHIRNQLEAHNSRVYRVNHGYNSPVAWVENVNLPGKSNIKALYAGNLAMPYIDWVLLWQVIEACPHVDFVFIGPGKDTRFEPLEHQEAKIEVFSKNNVYYLGRMDANELHRYYQSADILLVAYQERYHNDQANPHKMMGYLGSGKVVIATRTIEFEELSNNGMILMTKNNSEFTHVFQQTLELLQEWNNPEKQAMRKEYALSNSYENQISRIESIIGTL
jgi:glycosyltransferase involved in cell wall biosynthesis